LVVTAAPSFRLAIPRLGMAVADAAGGGEDTIVDVHAYALPDARVVDVVTLRPRRWPEETSTAERDETGRVAWRALPTLCAYLASSAGQRLVRERRRVLELGAGLGTPGLLCWRSGAALETTTTDGNKEVVDDLKRSIEMNRARVGHALDALGSIEARELAWGSKMGGDGRASG
jgi:predicted nicotinamide N-methyase